MCVVDEMSHLQVLTVCPTCPVQLIQNIDAAQLRLTR